VRARHDAWPERGAARLRLPPPPLGRRLPPTGRDYPPHLDNHVAAIALAELADFRARPTGGDRPRRSARQAVRQAERELAAYLEGVAAAGLSPGQYADGARQRGEAIEVARERLATLLERERTTVDGDPLEAWARMDQAQRNRLLRSLIEAVIVVPVGRGRHVPAPFVALRPPPKPHRPGSCAGARPMCAAP
jgi:hypothetical protein